MVKALKQMVKCPNCSKSFQDSDLEMVAGMGNHFLVKMSCGSCGLSLMASMMQVNKSQPKQKMQFNMADLMNMPEMTETHKENNDTISTNDVISVHEFLKDFDGNFKTK